MRVCLLLFTAAILFSPGQISAGGNSAPFGLERRIPLTTSRVIGSPSEPPPYRVKRTFSRLTFRQPLCVTSEPGTENLLVIEHLGDGDGPGRILRFKNKPDIDKTEELLQIKRIVYGIAFHPNFLRNGYIYLGSNGPQGDKIKKDRVSRFTIDRKPPYRCDPKSELVILEWESDGHNGADLAFGNDGCLYISSGDGTSDSDTNLRGQDLTYLTSKVLRIDVDHPGKDKPYSVPKDNPFVSRPGTRPETWAYGFRNPWRLTFDRKTNQLWVAQNGQDLWEQAFLVQRAGNYGWSVYEGNHPFQLPRQRGPEPILKPTVEHHHSEARSLTGGIVYHGSKLRDLQGAYIYGDYSTGKIWGVLHDGHRVVWNRELADTRLQITGFGADKNGELFVVDHVTGLYELEPTPKVPRPRFPTRLSETGLFASVKDHRPQPGLIPYSVNAPLWSDGAAKERFIALPGNSQIEFTTNRGWTFPDGTVLVKTFSLDLDTGNAASRRRIETRLLTRQDGEWAGYSYIWNEEQTEADLVEAAGKDKVYSIRNPAAPTGQLQQTWHYPSRAECMVCHSRAAIWVLGLTELQMNKTHDYGARSDNQLRTLEHIGVFRINCLEHFAEIKAQLADILNRSREKLEWAHETLTSIGPVSLPIWHAIEDSVARLMAHFVLEPARTRVQSAFDQVENKLRATTRYTTLLPKRYQAYRRLVDPYDRRESVDARARSYLHANCSQCHVPAGGGNSLLDLEFTTPMDQTRLIEIQPQHDSFNLPEARLIAPGHPERSTLYYRMANRGRGQMPPLASSRVDPEALELLRNWIAQLKPLKVASGPPVIR